MQSYRLLKEALLERNYFLAAAPFQSKEIGITIPTPSRLESYFWYFPATLLYHLIYYKQLMNSEYQEKFSGPRPLLKSTLRAHFPNLPQIHAMAGSVMYEGQINDGRTNVLALLSATVDQLTKGMVGANIANYVEFNEFVKDKEGRIEGATVTDTLGKKQFTIRSKYVVNCTGVMADHLRTLDNPAVPSRILGSRGTHLIFRGDLVPEGEGVIIPKTKDGRLLFIINYFGNTMVGTTDDECEKAFTCKPEDYDIKFIFEELKPYFGHDFDFEGQLISAWAGMRPLVVQDSNWIQIEEQKVADKWGSLTIRQKADFYFVKGLRKIASVVNSWRARRKEKQQKAKEESQGDGPRETLPKKKSAKLSRSHEIEISDSGLVSVMGGKWTSFRRMGEDTIDLILEHNHAQMKQKGLTEAESPL